MTRGMDSELGVVHELVHAIDDQNDWYLNWAMRIHEAEQLAQATEKLLGAGINELGAFQNYAARFQDWADARQSWRDIWLAFHRVRDESTIITRWWGLQTVYSDVPLGSDFISKVNTIFGVRFSCSQLEPLYERDLLRNPRLRGAYDPKDPKCRLDCSFNDVRFWNPPPRDQYFVMDRVFD